MKKTFALAVRNGKETLRDPLNLFFGLAFPLLLLLLLTAIQRNVPADLFTLEKLTPGVAVFGYSFLTLFSAMLLAKDRAGEFLTRLYAMPISAVQFIAGYALPLFPVAVMQTVVTFGTAFALGLKVTGAAFACAGVSLLSSLFFIALGLVAGSLFNDKQVGGLCGALLTNLTALTSGAWFDLAMVGGTFNKMAHVLPFANAVDLGRSAIGGSFAGTLSCWIILVAYIVVTAVLSVLCFLRQMKKH